MKGGLALQIIEKLKENGPISIWKISKQLKLPEQYVRYWVNNLAKTGVVKKYGSKYRLISDYFNFNGSIIMYDQVHHQFLFLLCPYADKCKCPGKITEDCKLWKSLPNEIKKLIIKKKKK